MLKKIAQFYELVKVKKRNLISTNSSESPQPINFVKVFHKEYPRLESTPLIEHHEDGELQKSMRSRRSMRQFLNQSISLNDLSLLLEGCRIYERNGFFERRSYPSAGARFPVEIYSIAFNVDGLKRGAYHYNSNKNTLELLLEEDLREQASDFVSPFIKTPATAIVMTSVIPRAEVKYGIKAYPFSLIEAGHIGQNISLLSAKYNLGCCAIGGYVDETIIRVLDLTPDEIPIYAIAIGKVNEAK